MQPTQTGVEAEAGAGRRGGAFFNQAAQSLQTTGERIGQAIREAGDRAENYMDHQQINAGADHGATLFANLTDQWNKTAASADPHDPSVAQKFRTEVLDPQLAQFSSGFTTQASQDWANRFSNNLRTHFFEKTEADMSSMAKDAVATTVGNLGNKLSNTAVTDPSSVSASLSMIDHSIDGILGANPNIKGPDAQRVRLEVGEKLKAQIVKAGAFGAIQSAADPEAAAADWAKRYPDYVNGQEELALAKAAKTQARVNLAYDKQAVLAQKQIDTLGVDTARNKIWADNVSQNPDGSVILKPDFFKQSIKLPQQYPNAPNATETARTLLDWGERMQKPEKIVTDPATASDIDGRMFAADNPATVLDVRKAEAAGKMSTQDGTLRVELIKARDAEPIKDPQFKYAVDGAKQAIEGTTAGEKMLASGKFAGFMQNFLGSYLKQSRAGTLPPNALDLNDPESLISKTIAPYKSPLSAVIQSNGGVGTPSTTPGVSETPPVSLPPIKERVSGHNYQTPRGMMTWTGTGWRPMAGS